jgi:PAS domain S-box-containing protein
MSPELILTLNYDLIITSLNDTPYFTLGHSCIDVNIVNKSIFDVFTFKNDDINYIAKGIKNNTITNISAYCNNNLFNISINSIILRNDLVFVFTCFLLKDPDFTSADQKLELLTRIIDYTDQMVWTVALPKYNTVFLNSAVEKIYGYTIEDFFKFDNLWYKCVYVDDRDFVKEKMKEVIEKKFLVVKHRIVHKNGDIRWIKNHLAYWSGECGRPDYIHGIATDITSSVEDINISENQTSLLNSLLENLPDIVYAKSLNGVYLKCNKEFEIFNNLPASDIIGLNDFELFGENNARKFIEQDREIIQTGLPLTVKTILTSYSGIQKTFLTTKSPLRNGNNEIIGIIGVSRDITDTINAQQALNESEAKYRLVVNSLKEVVFQANELGVWLFLNPIWESISGYTVEESLYRSFENFLVPYEIQKNRIYFRELLSKDREYCKFETKLKTKGNEIKWIEIFAQLQTTETNQPITISGTITDISSRKEMEEKIYSLNLLHSLINEISSLLIQSNFNEISLSINKALNMLGDYANVDRVYIFEFDYLNNTMNNTYEWCAEGVTPEIDNLKNLPNDLIPRWFEKFNNNEYVYIHDVSQIEEEYLTEKEILEPQGIISLLTIPIFFIDKLVGFIGFDSVKKQREWDFEYIALLRLAAEIISGALHRRNFETELMRAKEISEKANTAKSEFIANMSHEIRSPMNAILGFSEILLNMVKTPQEKNFLNSILISGKTLLALINDILDLSKIESGRIELFKEPINLTSLIKEIEQIFSYQANNKKIEIKTVINFNNSYNFIIDEIRLRQVLFNLVGNAVKFTEEGSVIIETSFLINNDSPNFGTLIIKVKDSGIGISKEHFNLIFESFRQATNGETKKYGGTGLGLAISKRLVNLMGGEITVESEINKGSTFIVTIMNIELSENTSKNKTQTNQNNIQTKFLKSDILIIDDIDSNREIAKIILTELGLNVLQANSFNNAKPILDEIIPSVILMDIRMPDINGIEAAKKIRLMPNTNKTKIIAFTASSKSDKEIYGEFKFDGIIRKPIMRDKLIETLKDFIPFETDNNNKNDNNNITIKNNKFILDNKLIDDLENLIIPQIKMLKETVVMDDLDLLINNFKNLWNNSDNLIFYNEIKELQVAKTNYDFEQIGNILNLIHEIYIKAKNDK